MINEKLALTKFGENLKKLRLSKGYNQEELAFQTNFDRTYISLLERGHRNPSLTTVCRMAKILGIKMEELFEGVV